MSNLDNGLSGSGISGPAGEARPTRLREALRRARIEAADRTAVVVDLRDAEVARLEILSEALDPLFDEIPSNVELFDRGISRGDTPRLWIDAVAHVVMGRDKRLYRFVQDTRFGRLVLAESHEVSTVVSAVTDYVARRIIEREHALVTLPVPGAVPLPGEAAPAGAGAAGASAAPAAATMPAAKRAEALPKARTWLVFALGFIAGGAALFALALLAALRWI